MAERLRPFKVTEIVDRAFALYRANVGLFIGITAIAYIPLGAASVFLNASLRRYAQAPVPIAPGRIAAYFGIGAVVYLLLSMAVMVAQGSLAVAVADRYLDLPITFGAAYRRSLKRMGPLVGTLALTALALGFGYVASLCFCGIPAIWLWMGLSFAPQAVVLEGLGATQALTRSWHLSRGDRFRIFCMMALVWCAVASAWVTSSVVGQILFRSPVVAAILTQLGGLLVMPVMQVGLVLMYFDSRVRKEGFDLALLAAQLSVKAPLPASARAW